MTTTYSGNRMRRQGAPPDGTRASPSVVGYRPDLDGLRGVAILMVFAFHNKAIGGRSLEAGFLGVDVFFVLSGFLITSLLLRENERRGTIDLRAFYFRRALRLLPALVLALLLAWLVISHISPPGSWMDFPKSVVAVVGYAGNWFQHRLGLLGHTWSLALEEQFYLLWPPLLVVLLGRRMPRATLAGWLIFGALVLGLGQLVWRDVVLSPFSRDPSIAIEKYGRFAGLALGASVAVAPRLFSWTKHAHVAVFALVGMGVVVANPLSTSTSRKVGIFVLTVSVALTIGHLVHNPEGGLSKALSLPSLVGVGRVSYGLYLFHWPVFVFVSEHLEDGILAESIGWMATFALAVASFELVERHALRLKDRLSLLSRGTRAQRSAGVMTRERRSAGPTFRRPPTRPTASGAHSDRAPVALSTRISP